MMMNFLSSVFFIKDLYLIPSLSHAQVTMIRFVWFRLRTVYFAERYHGHQQLQYRLQECIEKDAEG